MQSLIYAQSAGDSGPRVMTSTVGSLLDDLIVPVSELIAPAHKVSPAFRYAVNSVSDVRDLVQRDMAGAKRKNALTELPEYIRRRLTAGRWQAPVWPFTIYLPHGLEPTAVRLPGGLQEYGFSRSNLGFCLDGESRAYALELVTSGDKRVWGGDPDWGFVERLREVPVIVHIYDGIGATDAAQYFRDINGLGVGINQALLVSRDMEDPWVRVVRAVFDDLGVKLEGEARQVGPRSDKVLTVVAARTMIAAMVRGIGAVSYGGGAIPTEIDGQAVDFDQLEIAAKMWLTHVFSTLGVSSFRDRDQVLRSGPVIVALGALGRPFYFDDTDGEMRARATLAGVNWKVGEAWSGLAGKFTPSGSFSVASAKESGHAVFRALTDQSDPGYVRIRSGS